MTQIPEETKDYNPPFAQHLHLLDIDCEKGIIHQAMTRCGTQKGAVSEES